MHYIMLLIYSFLIHFFLELLPLSWYFDIIIKDILVFVIYRCTKVVLDVFGVCFKNCGMILLVK